MADTAGVAIARLQEQLAGIRDDLAELASESGRTRQRLHNLEGLTGALVDAQKQREQETADRQRRLEVRTEVIAVVIALAAFVQPVIFYFIPGHFGGAGKCSQD